MGDLPFRVCPSESCGVVIEMESDLVDSLFLLGSIDPDSSSSSAEFRPMRPLLVATVLGPAWRVGTAGRGARGVPGEVGGRAIGTELIECALRLWVVAAECEADRGGLHSGLRVFVKVIVTEKGSPAK